MHQKKDNTYTGNWDDLNLITLKNKTRQREKKNGRKRIIKKSNKKSTTNTTL